MIWRKYKNHILEYKGKKYKFHFMDCQGWNYKGQYYEFWFYYYRSKIVVIRWFIDGVEQYE